MYEAFYYFEIIFQFNLQLCVLVDVYDFTNEIILHAVGLKIIEKETRIEDKVGQTSLKIKDQTYDTKKEVFVISIFRNFTIAERNLWIHLKFVNELEEHDHDEFQSFAIEKYKVGNETR